MGRDKPPPMRTIDISGNHSQFLRHGSVDLAALVRHELQADGIEPRDVALRLCGIGNRNQIICGGTDRSRYYTKKNPQRLSSFDATNRRDWERFRHRDVQPNAGTYVFRAAHVSSEELQAQVERHTRISQPGSFRRAGDGASRLAASALLMVAYDANALDFRTLGEPDFALFNGMPQKAIRATYLLSVAVPPSEQSPFARSKGGPAGRRNASELAVYNERLSDDAALLKATDTVYRSLTTEAGREALITLVQDYDRRIDPAHYRELMTVLAAHLDKIKNCDEILIYAQHELPAYKNLPGYLLELQTFRVCCELPGARDIYWGEVRRNQEFDVIFTLDGQRIIIENKLSQHNTTDKRKQRGRLLDHAREMHAWLVYVYGLAHPEHPGQLTIEEFRRIAVQTPDRACSIISRYRQG